MGEAVWLYIYLLQLAGFETGVVERYNHIDGASTLGIPLRTARRWFSVLVENEYVTARHLQYCIEVKISKFLSQSDRARTAKYGPPEETRTATNGLPEQPGRPQVATPGRPQTALRTATGGHPLSYRNEETDLRKTSISRSLDDLTKIDDLGKTENEEREILECVQTIEKILGYERYVDRDAAIRQCTEAIRVGNPPLTCQELQLCAIWMLETNGAFWGNRTLEIKSIPKQMTGFRKAWADGWRPKEINHENINGAPGNAEGTDDRYARAKQAADERARRQTGL